MFTMFIMNCQHSTFDMKIRKVAAGRLWRSWVVVVVVVVVIVIVLARWYRKSKIEVIAVSSLVFLLFPCFFRFSWRVHPIPKFQSAMV